jgi:alkylhydroperoxidase family enzyme
MARIPPLEPPYTDEVGVQLRSMMPPGVEPIALFRTFVRNPGMTEAMRPWGGYELGRELTLSLRDREVVIARTCARCGCEYEWGVHIAFFAERAGLDGAQVASLTHGTPSDPCWTVERDRLLVEAVDELHVTSDIGDDLWARLAAELTEQQLLDLLLLTGWYHAVSYAARAARVELEPGAPRFADVAVNRPARTDRARRAARGR